MAVFTASPSRATIDPNGQDAPPQIVAQAKQRAAQKDYAGLEAMVAEIDAQYQGNRGSDYFRCLIGIHSVLVQAQDSIQPDYGRLWLKQKLLWKIFLTPYSKNADAAEIQSARDMLSMLVVPVPIFTFDRDRDQFVALRSDAVHLLEAYAAALRQRAIPGYQFKEEHGFAGSGVTDPSIQEALRAEEKRREAEFTQNSHDNFEQLVLMRSIAGLERVALGLIRENFSWPPDDDAMVNELLDVFPPRSQSRQSVLEELGIIRKARLAELQRLQEMKKR